MKINEWIIEALTRSKPLVWDANELEQLANEHRQSFRSAAPFPHVVIDDFLPVFDAKQILEKFPATDSKIWLDWRKRNTSRQPRKQGIGHARRLNGVDPYLEQAMSAFNSFPFLNFLEKLTGIEKLLPDPYFHGGGPHQILDGGKLDIHTDFNHLKKLDLFRRINVLFYLNKDWEDSYGGNLELLDFEGDHEKKLIAPTFNRLVVFLTDKKSLHGHPTPLSVPIGITRKSLAFYYYTSKPEVNKKYDQITDWHPNKDDSSHLL